MGGRLWVVLVLDRTPNVDEIVGNHLEPDPALHSHLAAVWATIETVAPLATLTRPSHPVRRFWPLRNQRFSYPRLRSGLLVE
jgi:hypothetical protein